MESKYYTPTIDEFYVGFEYEECLFKETWDKAIYDDSFPLKTTFGLDQNVIRVKYLDKEDIESLGFTTEHVVNGLTDELELGYELEVDNDNSIIINNIGINEYLIYKQEVYSKITGNWKQIDLFRGNIKNLSELKKLLKQLGINE